MFVSYLLLTLFHTETAMLARPGGEVSQIKYLVRSYVFVSSKFPLLFMKRDGGIGFRSVQRIMLYVTLSQAFLTGKLLFLKNPVLSKLLC